jgi:hypothetical protein
MALAAPVTTGDQHASGFVLLAWGLFASAIGWGLITNFRGFADTYTRTAMSSSSGLRRIPPWKWLPRKSAEQEVAERRTLVRFIAIPFAIIGPFVALAGVVETVRGHIGISRGPALPLPFALFYIAIALVAIVQYWRRGGFFRHAAEQGGWTRVTAVVAALGMLSFGVFTALGETTLGVAGWLVGGLAAVAMVTSVKTAGVAPPAAEPTTSTLPEPSAPTDPDEEDGDDDAAFRWL